MSSLKESTKVPLAVNQKYMGAEYDRNLDNLFLLPKVMASEKPDVCCEIYRIFHRSIPNR